VRQIPGAHYDFQLDGSDALTSIRRCGTRTPATQRVRSRRRRPPLLGLPSAGSNELESFRNRTGTYGFPVASTTRRVLRMLRKDSVRHTNVSAAKLGQFGDPTNDPIDWCIAGQSATVKYMHTSSVQVCYWWGAESPLGHQNVASMRIMTWPCSTTLEHTPNGLWPNPLRWTWSS
jgi:hypothetical protein